MSDKMREARSPKPGAEPPADLADDKDLNAEIKALRRAMLREEIGRFRLAATALMAIAVLTLAFLVATVFGWTKVQPSWELVALWGFASLCVALPLFSKLSVSKDGGGFEVASPLDLLDAFEAKADAGRSESLKEMRQAIAGVSMQIKDLGEELSSRGRRRLADLPVDMVAIGAELTLRDIRKMLPAPTNEDDPQKGRFGGQEKSATRALTARVERSDIGADWKRVTLTLTSLDGAPIQGAYAYFFLHNTFEPDAYRVRIKPGAKSVTFETSATGAFTAGVCAEYGQTMLEIDLATSPNVKAPQWFRDR